MRQSLSTFQRLVETFLPTASLAVILLFTYVRFFGQPYIGFYFNPTDGEVWEIYFNEETASDLMVGDKIEAIGNVSWSDYQSDGRAAFFKNAQAGDIVQITVVRDGETINIPWVIPGFTSQEFMSRFINTWWLAYIFWLLGLLAQTVLRPKDTRTRLLVIANYLTGIWMIVGGISASHLWESSLIVRALTWLLLPIYIHLHWVFPRPLSEVSAQRWIIFYTVPVLLAVGELVQVLPRSFYFLGFLLMLAAMVSLLIAHAVRQPAQRREVALLGLAILLALIPLIFLGLTGMSNRIPQLAPMALLSFPLVPGTYLYIVYRQQLGGLEMRANRVVSIYSFLILLGAIFLLLIAPATLSPIEPGQWIIFSSGLALVSAYASLALFPSFQSFVDRRVLGIKLPYLHLPETFSSRITTSTSLQSLLELLEEDIFPSLLVREFVFMRPDGDIWQTLLAKGIEQGQLPSADQANELAARAWDQHLPADNFALHWIRLIIPLKVGATVAGLWLLGRRDPDDAYHEAEIPVLQSLANQTAIAMSNLLQSERLQDLYRMDIDRREQERMRLALDLHDSVLNQLAVLRMNVDEPSLSPKFQQAYDEVVQRLREIVTDLRPPTLNYGLKLALEELAQDLTERSEHHARVTLAMRGDEERYSPHIELHLFRIVQEACENALRHAKAANVVISAQLGPQKVMLDIEDDGVGFEAGEQLELDNLLVNKHFGLAGIVERANLIGARADIKSGTKTGTRIIVVWGDGRLMDQV